MEKPEDFGGGKADNLYCRYCSDYQGNLLPRDQVRQNMIQFYIQKMEKSPEEAAVAVDQVMANMPAWHLPAGEAGQNPTPTTPTAMPSEPSAPAQPSVQEPVIEIGSLGNQPIVEPLKEPEPVTPAENQPVAQEPAIQPVAPENKPPEPTS